MVSNPSLLKYFTNDPDELSFIESARSNRQIVLDAISKQVETRRKFEEFTKEFNEFSRIESNSERRMLCEWRDRYPCLDDKSSTTPFDRHYTYHPAWAARVLAKIQPSKHIDISSTINFATLVSAFISVDFYDYRPAQIDLPNLCCGAADLTNFPFRDGELESLSCMHVIEHVGLGRYGDALDPDGDLKAINELLRVVAPGGNLLIVVPVGGARIQFNAHRVYDVVEFIDHFQGASIIERALIEDSGPSGIIVNRSDAQFKMQAYGCGCFWFRKN